MWTADSVVWGTNSTATTVMPGWLICTYNIIIKAQGGPESTEAKMDIIFVLTDI